MKEKNKIRKDISEDEIQILGKQPQKKFTWLSKKSRKIMLILFSLLIIIAALILISLFFNRSASQPSFQRNAFHTSEPLENNAIEKIRAYTEVVEESINDVPLTLFIPHHAVPELTLTRPDESDSSIIFITRAADVGADNYKIVGDFVLAGERLARGKSKKGFCSIINGQVEIGMGDETEAMDRAIQESGYFFRQYPLVHDFTPIINKPKGKSIRRALAIKDDKIMIVVSRSRESFHDFAVALADLGISDAIYLPGGNGVFGWAYTKEGEQIIFGQEAEKLWEEDNWILWRAKTKN